MIHSHPAYRRASLYCLLLSLWSGVMACSIVPADTSTDFPFQLLMTPEDLPAEWGRAGSEAPEVPGAISRLVGFTGSTDPQQEYLLVKHQLAVYPSEQAGKDAYSMWEQKWFPTITWQRPPEASFEPRDPSDQFRFACINVKINGFPIMTCTYLQQHRNLVSLVLVNVDGKAITLEQFEQALKKLDERLQSVNTETPATTLATSSP